MLNIIDMWSNHKSNSNEPDIITMITEGNLEGVIETLENSEEFNTLYTLMLHSISVNQLQIFKKLLEYNSHYVLFKSPLVAICNTILRANKFEFYDALASSCIDVKVPASHQQFFKLSPSSALENLKLHYYKYVFYAAVIELNPYDRIIIINKFNELKENMKAVDLFFIKNHFNHSFPNLVFMPEISRTLESLNPLQINIDDDFKKDLATGVLNLLEEHYTKVCIFDIISLHKTLGLVCKEYKDKLLSVCDVPEEINYLVISSLHNPYPFSIDASTYHIVTTKYESLKVQHLDNPKYKSKALIRDLYEEVKENQLQL